MRIATLFVACATVATALATNSSTDPQIKVTHDGKLVSVVDGQSYDHGDMASKTVQRRNSENIVDLMKEMILGNKALAGSIDSQVRQGCLVSHIALAPKKKSRDACFVYTCGCVCCDMWRQAGTRNMFFGTHAQPNMACVVGRGTRAHSHRHAARVHNDQRRSYFDIGNAYHVHA